MKKTLIAILLAVALTVIPVSSALAATTADVTVTATPGWVSITVNPTSHDFGVVLAGATPDTTATGFTITNDSTVNMDVDIQCTSVWSPTTGSNSWTYADTPDEDTGSLNFSTTGGAPWTFIPSATTASLASDVGTAVDPTFDLQLEAPTSFTHVDEQECTITLTASVHT
jgi:ABC-type proline/glycine betaine transport system substrate-binding protein